MFRHPTIHRVYKKIIVQILTNSATIRGEVGKMQGEDKVEYG